jgi:predicted DNA-binding WGR domain protein
VDRIGTHGQELVEVFVTETETGQAVEAVAQAKRCEAIAISEDK